MRFRHTWISNSASPLNIFKFSYINSYFLSMPAKCIFIYLNCANFFRLLLLKLDEKHTIALFVSRLFFWQKVKEFVDFSSVNDYSFCLIQWKTLMSYLVDIQFTCLVWMKWKNITCNRFRTFLTVCILAAFLTVFL